MILQEIAGILPITLNRPGAQETRIALTSHREDIIHMRAARSATRTWTPLHQLRFYSNQQLIQRLKKESPLFVWGLSTSMPSFFHQAEEGLSIILNSFSNV